ncbi:MAG: SDR family NAD(P)-dependent oxidoreductase, partial [Acidobacteriota bacterium]
MNLGSNTVLITGGGSGIGLALAKRFLRAGSEVIACGRREDRLREAKEKNPKLHTHVADVSDDAGRVALFEWAVREFPRLNVLVNNAGIQHRISLAEPGQWERMREEIAINLDAPIHLTTLFLPRLRPMNRAAIVNITSGLSFAPMSRVPVYCATKAALHSFTLSLRHQLADTAVEVVEIIPPAVDTDLGGPGLHKFGVNVDEFLDAVLPKVEAGQYEVAFGFSQQSSQGSRAELDALSARLNQSPPI